MLASDQMCMDFRRTHLFSSENSKQINSSLLTYLSKYLSVVCERLKQAQVCLYSLYCMYRDCGEIWLAKMIVPQLLKLLKLDIQVSCALGVSI